MSRLVDVKTRLSPNKNESQYFSWILLQVFVSRSPLLLRWERGLGFGQKVTREKCLLCFR